MNLHAPSLPAAEVIALLAVWVFRTSSAPTLEPGSSSTCV